MRRPASVLAALVMLASAGCGSGPNAPRLEDASARGADYSYTIPAGAGEAYDRGQPLDILPGELTVAIGEVIEIVNLDARGHLIGPFFVGAGETLRQRFAGPGEFIGVCTVHPSGELVLVVHE
ncbi:MAG: hypothetical protein KJ698_08835 [Actinobacteria bacterium]|nr:hypothetical protein [Actinomycetota bacterium]MBU1494703.1 hypothetical protein [Actinomycetota bacterium]MBU1865846.1 hypothetical protein [Actinomycetota bacterium]